MTENVKHHFIPQCYLSNFSIDGKGIWVYNKQERKSYLTSIDKIFQIKHFYKIPDEFISEQDKDKINALSIEKEFFANQVEAQFSQYLKMIIHVIDELLKKDSELRYRNYKLHEDFITEFAMQMAIQFFRTPKARQEVMQVLDNLLGKIQKEESEYVNNNFVSELSKPYIHDPTIAHFWTIFANKNFIPNITKILKNKIWITYVSPYQPFYTSDSPIIVEDQYNTPIESDISLNMKGSIITYPLTSKILFKLLDREYYVDMKEEHYSIKIANEEFVKRENIKQFLHAQNQIVSPVDNFDSSMNS